MTPRSVKRKDVLQERRDGRWTRKLNRRITKARKNDPRYISPDRIYAEVMAQLDFFGGEQQ